MPVAQNHHQWANTNTNGPTPIPLDHQWTTTTTTNRPPPTPAIGHSLYQPSIAEISNGVNDILMEIAILSSRPSVSSLFPHQNMYIFFSLITCNRCLCACTLARDLSIDRRISATLFLRYLSTFPNTHCDRTYNRCLCVRVLQLPIYQLTEGRM